MVVATITYPLTGQDIAVFYGPAAPIVYAPFHERICKWFPSLGFTAGDLVGGNTPSQKNVSAFTISARTRVVDRRYAEQLASLVDSTRGETCMNDGIIGNAEDQHRCKNVLEDDSGGTMESFSEAHVRVEEATIILASEKMRNKPVSENCQSNERL